MNELNNQSGFSNKFLLKRFSLIKDELNLSFSTTIKSAMVTYKGFNPFYNLISLTFSPPFYVSNVKINPSKSGLFEVGPATSNINPTSTFVIFVNF